MFVPDIYRELLMLFVLAMMTTFVSSNIFAQKRFNDLKVNGMHRKVTVDELFSPRHWKYDLKLAFSYVFCCLDFLVKLSGNCFIKFRFKP